MIKFGPAGNDKLFYDEGHKSTVEAPAWLKNMGLNAFEYSFGKGVLLKDDTAVEIGRAMQENGIEISVHAPYFINFANPDEEMVEKSYNYVLNSLHKLQLLGGNRCIIHIGSCGKLDRDTALSLIRDRLEILVGKVKEAGYTDMKLCIETMGKQAQIGTYTEIIDLCTIDDMIMPTFDFGHINALTGGTLKEKKDFEKIFDYCYEKLGEWRTKNVHIHFSKIEFSAKGEVKHLTFEDNVYGPDFEPLAEVIRERGYTPVIICESKEVMAQDALIMKNIYEAK